MNRNTLIIVSATGLLGASAVLLKDGLIYLTVLIMALTTLGLMRILRSRIMKLTRWAKAHPGKAQGLIAATQLVLLALAIIAGKNLKELGFVFTDLSVYLFSILLAVGFFFVPFWPKRGTLALPQIVYRQRLVYLGITLSSLTLMAIFGNRIEDTHPNSIVAYAIESVDQAIFSPTIIPQTGMNASPIPGMPNHDDRGILRHESEAMAVFVVAPSSEPESVDQSLLKDNIIALDDREEMTTHKKDQRAKKKEQRGERKNFMKSLRRAVGGGLCVLAILLMILLLGTTCAGVCLFIFGVSEGSVAGIIFGPVIAALSILGIIRVVKWCKRSSK